MSKNKSKLFCILVVFAILAAASMACNVEPGDGQVGEAVMDGYNEIRDTASDVKDAVDATGDGLEFETHESPLPALWDWAKTVANSE